MSNYLFQYLKPGLEGQARVNRLCPVLSFPNALIGIQVFTGTLRERICEATLSRAKRNPGRALILVAR